MASAARGVTFCTDRRSLFFVQEAPVALVRAQILRAAREIGFEISAYCFMPDHLHLLVSGLHESSDAKLFISRSKQYSGYYFKRQHGVRLWQRYGYERVVRDDDELALTVGTSWAIPFGRGWSAIRRSIRSSVPGSTHPQN